MKRLHVHLRVENIEANVQFYSAMFGAPPTVEKPDYAKWMVEDPRVNFAISTGAQTAGLDHVGIQAENEQELADIQQSFASTEGKVTAQSDAECCYARSDKYWTVDPQGTPWEAFHTLGEVPKFGDDLDRNGASEGSACCTPSADSECCAG